MQHSDGHDYPPGETCREVWDRSRFAGLSPAAVLTLSVATVAAMPVAYLVLDHWSIATVWLFALAQVVTTCQGLVLVAACVRRKQCGKLRRAGLWLALYGAASLAALCWFAVLATLGSVPFGILWGVGAAVSVVAARALQRRLDAATAGHRAAS